MEGRKQGEKEKNSGMERKKEREKEKVDISDKKNGTNDSTASQESKKKKKKNDTKPKYFRIGCLLFTALNIERNGFDRELSSLKCNR